VPGVPPARIVVLGGGVVGMNAARMAAGLGAEVVIVERSIPRMRELDNMFQGRILTRYSTQDAVDEEVLKADVVVGAVLTAGASAPKLVRKEHLSKMKPGSVLVDVSIDQGGCFETSRPTTHSDPTYEVDGVTHYCVANMPGAVPITSTYALTNATLPYVLHVADAGPARAAEENPGLAKGFNVVAGKVTYQPVAEATGQPYVELSDVLGAAA
jgi:alanine dehydrogenase